MLTHCDTSFFLLLSCQSLWHFFQSSSGECLQAFRLAHRINFRLSLNASLLLTCIAFFCVLFNILFCDRSRTKFGFTKIGQSTTKIVHRYCNKNIQVSCPVVYYILFRKIWEWWLLWNSIPSLQCRIISLISWH